MRRSWRVVASRGRESAGAVSRRREAGRFSGGRTGAVRGCFARWLSGERGGKRAVKHGKSGLRAAICALFGTLRGDLCKTVEKLCKSLQGVKTKITNCAQRFVRLCVLVRELCKYRFLSAFGEWAVRCGGAPFGRFPSRLRRRGAHLGGEGGDVGGQGLGRRQASVGCCARGRPPLPSPSPTLRSALRPSAGKVHGRRQAHAGRTHGTSPISGRGLGLRRADAGRTHGQGGDYLVHFRLCAQ